jgi:hypothetical protein
MYLLAMIEVYKVYCNAKVSNDDWVCTWMDGIYPSRVLALYR